MGILSSSRKTMIDNDFPKVSEMVGIRMGKVYNLKNKIILYILFKFWRLHMDPATAYH